MELPAARIGLLAILFTGFFFFILFAAFRSWKKDWLLALMTLLFFLPPLGVLTLAYWFGALEIPMPYWLQVAIDFLRAFAPHNQNISQ